MAYPHSCHQLCLFHVKKNVLKRVKKQNLKEFSEKLRELFNSTTHTMFYNKLSILEKEFKEKESKALKYLKNLDEEVFTYLNFPSEIHQIITTNNYIERFIGSVRSFLNRRKCFNNLDSLELFFFVGVKKYNDKEFCIRNKHKEAFKKFTQKC